MMVRLHVNIDHVATLRQVRRAKFPDPVAAAALVELAGGDGITVHLREDRRHIQDRDLRLLRQTVKTFLNMEMATTDEMLGIALEVMPDGVCLVPESRQELTTEGGLDVLKHFERVAQVSRRLEEAGIYVSLFIDPDLKQIEAASRTGASFIEIHTGKYANAANAGEREAFLNGIREAAQGARQLGLRVNAGHGLDYHNTAPVAALEGIEELNIGHAIVSRAVLVGMDRAVRDMKAIIEKACG
jgi:pyridoxine 5-phosphate synthase